MSFANFQFRRGTATQWSLANPILLAGELGLETNTDKFKLGNGVDLWNVRPYGGIQGAQGATGPAGATGATGTAGTAGTNGAAGATGAAGRGISSILRTTGTGAAGTTDTYTITYSDTTTSTFQVVNGANGATGATGPTGATGAAGTGTAVAVSDEGVALTTAVTSFNFVGAGVTASNVGSSVTVTIPTPSIPLAANAAPPPVASVSSLGTNTNEYANENHTHQGVVTVAVNGGAVNSGAIALAIPVTGTIAPPAVGASNVAGTDSGKYANENHTHQGVSAVAAGLGISVSLAGSVATVTKTKNLATITNPTTIAETVVALWSLPANSIGNNDSFKVSAALKSAGTGTVTWRVRVGAAGTTADTQVVILTTSAAQVANSFGIIEAMLRASPNTSVIGAGHSIMQGLVLPTVVGAQVTATIVPTAVVFVSITATISIAAANVLLSALLRKED